MPPSTLFSFQHVVFGIVKLIDVVIPDIPGSVQLKIDIDATIAKLVLDDDNTVMVRSFYFHPQSMKIGHKFLQNLLGNGIFLYLTLT